MARLTQRDIVESVAGLREVAADLATATPSAEVSGAVIVRYSVLLNHIAYLRQVADELQTLIPDTPVKTPPP